MLEGPTRVMRGRPGTCDLSPGAAPAGLPPEGRERSREPNTYSQYELFSRRYIIPGLGKKRIDQLAVRDVQAWLNKLPSICQCCAQGKDANRPEHKRRCCAVGECW
jgi:Phage integrase, N-terminal SAM-like domain